MGKKLNIKLDNTSENESLKKRSGFKNFLKIVGLFSLVIVAVIVIGVVGAWATGSFNPEKIYIQSMSINGIKEYVAISDNDTSYTTKIDFAPANANQLALTPKILTGKDLIEPLPAITAGEDFELKFVKDLNGVTLGGEVEIKFLDSAQNSFVVLKLLIDVGLKSNAIEVSSNGNQLVVDESAPTTLSTNVLTTVTKENANVIKLSANYDNMLSSYKGNWSESENNNLATITKLKKMLLFFDEEDVSVEILKAEDEDGNQLDTYYKEVIGDENYYLIKYLTPYSSFEDESFDIDVYLYKTYNMENIFSESLARSLITALDKNSFDRETVDYAGLNTFINNYVYNSSSVATKNNFDLFRNSANGLIELDPTKITDKSMQFKQSIRDVVDYALASKTIKITIDNIEVKNIVNNVDELVFQVLQSSTYTIDDISNKMGISLSPVDSNADTTVLHNNLRQLDIFLAVGSSYDNYYNEINATGINLADKGKIMNSYFKIGSNYYKKIEDTDKFKITEINNDDGSRTWSIETLSPTADTDNLCLVYKYNNSFSDKVTIQTSDKKSTTFYYNQETQTWHTNPNKTNGLINLVNDGNDGYEFTTLAKLFNYKVACTPLEVKYTAGTISYNQLSGSSTIAINDEGTIYKNYNGQARVVEHGTEGLYYNRRDLKVDVNGLSQGDVQIKPDTEGRMMEYTFVKWFVKYNDNLYTEGEGDAQKTYYYIKPVVEGSWQSSSEKDEEKKNPTPKICNLMDISNGNYLLKADSSYETFMEIGDNNCVIEVLNSMASDGKIELYAVVVQTDINNNPIKYLDSDGKITYKYISYSKDHTINTTKFVENLYFYSSEESVNFTHSTQIDNNESKPNYATVYEDTGSSASNQRLNLSSFANLDISGNPTTSSQETDWIETTIVGTSVKNEIIMSNAINVIQNEKYAMERFYNDFLKFININGTDWSCGRVSQAIENGEYVGNSYSITIGSYSVSSESNCYITIKITNTSTGSVTVNDSTSKICPYIFSISNIGNSSSKFFTQVSALDGYFQLEEKV